VPPSVTPSPAVWAEYIAADADGAMQRREARQRQVFRLPQCWKVASASARLRQTPRSAGLKVQLLTYAIAESTDAGADKSCDRCGDEDDWTTGASRAVQTYDEARRFFATVRIVVSGDSCKCPREGEHGLESLARKSPLHKDRVRIPGDADVQTADLPARESVDFDDNARLAQGAEAELRPYFPGRGRGVKWYNRLNIRSHVSGQVLLRFPFQLVAGMRLLLWISTNRLPSSTPDAR
jgi:hypothetical protein